MLFVYLLSFLFFTAFKERSKRIVFGVLSHVVLLKKVPLQPDFSLAVAAGSDGEIKPWLEIQILIPVEIAWKSAPFSAIGVFDTRI